MTLCLNVQLQRMKVKFSEDGAWNGIFDHLSLLISREVSGTSFLAFWIAYLQSWKWRQYVSPKRRWASVGLHCCPYIVSDLLFTGICYRERKWQFGLVCISGLTWMGLNCIMSNVDCFLSIPRFVTYTRRKVYLESPSQEGCDRQDTEDAWGEEEFL
jgi:hypothetical protein